MRIIYGVSVYVPVSITDIKFCSAIYCIGESFSEGVGASPAQGAIGK